MNSQIVISPFQQDKCAWENAIAAQNSSENFEIWFNYISWYEQNCMNDLENKFTSTLERCLTTFEHNENYKQDLRMVKLWMKYIDMQQNPLHLYQLLYQRNIGTQCAAFYIAWAHYYDAANAFKQAESVYNLGLQAKAQPYEDLQESQTKFRLSIAQRMLYDDTPSKKRSASSLAEQRHIITSLNPPEKKARTEMEGFHGFDDTNKNQQFSTSEGVYGINRQQMNYNYNQSSSNSNGINLEYNNTAETDSQQCNLNNSAYMITTSLNSVYDNTNYNIEVEEPQVTVEMEGIKILPNFVRFARNSNEMWCAPLALEEPFDPNRRCCYPKLIVYPGDGNEYSLEEINARKWSKKRTEIWERNKILQQQQFAKKQIALYHQRQQLQQEQQQAQHQLNYQAHLQQELNQTNNLENHYNIPSQTQAVQPEHNNYQYSETQKHNHVTYQQQAAIGNTDSYSQYEQPNTVSQEQSFAVDNNNYTQNLNGSTNTVSNTENKNFNDMDDFEEQIEASTIRFCPNNGVNKSQTITIKYKKEKPSIGMSPSTTPKVPSNSKSRKKSKNVKTTEDKEFVPSSSSNSLDSLSVKYYQNNHNNVNNYPQNQNNYQVTGRDRKLISKNHMEDANLLLSIANLHSSSNDDSSQSYNQYTSMTVPETLPEQFLSNDDSYSNSDFNSFNGIYYGGENSNIDCGVGTITPIKNNNNNNINNNRFVPETVSSKTSTPTHNNFKYLKNQASNISNHNDDSMCSYSGEQSFFAAETDDDIKQRRIDKALATIETHHAKIILDPFSSELCKAFLTKVDFPPHDKPEICKVLNTVLPKLMTSKSSCLADTSFHIEKEVGRGSYGAVYRAVNSHTGAVVALKYQKPPNSWELYICTEVRKRICNQDMLPGFMGISSAILARNASILISEFSQYGSLLDINNRIRQATTKVMHESLVMHFTSQIINIVDHLHSCKIIHADIKPDNFLLMKIPTHDSHVPTLRLIDFGCAIDMSFFSPGTQFKKVVQTDGFTCIEMQDGRPWSYQTDLFCVAGTVHVMLFGEYMQLVKKFGSEWDIKQKLPRYLKKAVWSELFPKLLNIKDLDHLPNLKSMKTLIDNELYNMESELQKHIRALSNILHKR